MQYHLIDQLVSNHGYRLRSSNDYGCALALDKSLLLMFIKETQPDEWERLEEQYIATAETEFSNSLKKPSLSVAHRIISVILPLRPRT